tara:strand:+ start:1198 stop:1566 length:369 start_codon:yes stop_codon:yes gene_type:complete
MSIMMSRSLNGKFDIEDPEVDSKKPSPPVKNKELPIMISWGDEDFIFGDLLTASFDGNSLNSMAVQVVVSPMALLLSGKNIQFVEFNDIGYNYDISEKCAKVSVSKSINGYIIELVLENDSE